MNEFPDGPSAVPPPIKKPAAMFAPRELPQGTSPRAFTAPRTPSGLAKAAGRGAISFLVTMVLAIVALLGATAMANADPKPSATLSADGKTLSSTNTYPEQTTDNGQGRTTVKGSSETTTEQTGHSFDQVSANGTVTLEYNNALGMPKAEYQKAEKLGKCKWMKDGWNSGMRWINGKRQLVFWQDHTRRYVCYTGKGVSGYHVKGCNNDYLPKGMTPPKKYSRAKTVHLVRSLVGTPITGTISVNTESNATGSSESWAETKQCRAHGVGSYTAHAGAAATAAFSIKITQKMDLKAKLQNAFVQFALKQQAKYEANAWAEASSHAQGKARSDASCEDFTPPPVTVTMPPQPVPTITVTATTTTTVTATETKTVTTPGPTTIVTQSASPAPTVTETKEVPVPGPEKTIIKEVPVPGPTITKEVPGPTVTVSASSTPPADTPKPGKPVVNVERMNDQEIKTSTKGIKVSYTIPGSGQADVQITTTLGTIRDISQTTVSGTGVVTFTYVAPTENAKGEQSTITATIRTKDTGQTGSYTTEPFDVTVPGSSSDNPNTPT